VSGQFSICHVRQLQGNRNIRIISAAGNDGRLLRVCPRAAKPAEIDGDIGWEGSNMKVVLREDVDKLGERGSVQSVSDGYARNYLIPKGFAVLATPGELKVVAENARVRERKVVRQEQLLQSLAEKINGQRLTFTARAGDQGRLYGSITAGDIAERLTQSVGTDIDRRKVVLNDAIRSLGEHTVTVHLVGRLRPEVTVIVNAEHVAEEAPAAEAQAETEAVTADA
jgi:large subunit ribosomal protein L9